MLSGLKLSELDKKIVIIYGATASGKSEFAFQLALRLMQQGQFHSSCIINADSMQVYHEIPIITAQPTPNQISEISHKLYGFISCITNHEIRTIQKHQIKKAKKDNALLLNSPKFSVGNWLDLVNQEIHSCLKNCVVPIIVGGTGMYISALINGLANIPAINPKIFEQLYKVMDEVSGIEVLYSMLQECDSTAASKIQPNDIQRIIRALAVYQSTGRTLSYWQNNAHQSPLYSQDKFVKIFMNQERPELYKRINTRFDTMLQKGAIDEVDHLISHNTPSIKAIGINEITSYLRGEMNYQTMVETATKMSRNYAKRQLTWFRNQLVPDLVVDN